jgi:hypothetical protein
VLSVARHALAALAASSSFGLIHRLIEWLLPPSDTRVLSAVSVVDRAVLASVVCVFGVSTLASLVVAARAAYFQRKRRPAIKIAQPKQPQELSGTSWILSYGAGLAGTIVTFALARKAAVMDDGVSKLLIYVAAFLLAIEVVFMFARRVWSSEMEVALSSAWSSNSG